MDEFDVEYLIGDVAKMFNISPGTIRHYEKIGLVQSLKEDSNNYRRYNLFVLDQLRHVILLRSLELSLDEIFNIQNDFVDDMEDVLHTLENNKQRIEDKIKYYNSVNHKTSDLISQFKKYQSNANTIKLKQSPTMHIVSSSNKLDLKELTKNFHTVLHESTTLPKSAFILNKESLIKNDFDSTSYIQFGVLVNTDLVANNDSITIPSKTCVYAMYTGGLPGMREKYREMLDWMEAQNYYPADDAIEICNFSIGNHYIFEIYIPVARKES